MYAREFFVHDSLMPLTFMVINSVHARASILFHHTADTQASHTYHTVGSKNRDHLVMEISHFLPFNYSRLSNNRTDGIIVQGDKLDQK